MQPIILVNENMPPRPRKRTDRYTNVYSTSQIFENRTRAAITVGSNSITREQALANMAESKAEYYKAQDVYKLDAQTEASSLMSELEYNLAEAFIVIKSIREQVDDRTKNAFFSSMSGWFPHFVGD